MRWRWVRKQRQSLALGRRRPARTGLRPCPACLRAIAMDHPAPWGVVGVGAAQQAVAPGDSSGRAPACFL